ncbi:hypothetical protein, partial [Burkholderia pseudomallei]|uniref:hypothetical protein n=1 Tax=Burkholderia pseudomallei TaxID=28450 RepID=UPI000CCE80F7
QYARRAARPAPAARTRPPRSTTHVGDIGVIGALAARWGRHVKKATQRSRGAAASRFRSCGRPTSAGPRSRVIVRLQAEQLADIRELLGLKPDDNA